MYCKWLVCSSGPLFSFDVHDDVRLISDASVERDEVCHYGCGPLSQFTTHILIEFPLFVLIYQ